MCVSRVGNSDTAPMALWSSISHFFLRKTIAAVVKCIIEKQWIDCDRVKLLRMKRCGRKFTEFSFYILTTGRFLVCTIVRSWNAVNGGIVVPCFGHNPLLLKLLLQEERGATCQGRLCFRWCVGTAITVSCVTSMCLITSWSLITLSQIRKAAQWPQVIFDYFVAGAIARSLITWKGYCSNAD